MKLAVVASGWHFPEHFYKEMVKQHTPPGWEVEFYCVSHRDPKFAREEKKGRAFEDGVRGELDRKLYNKIISKTSIEALGWHYKEYPNTVGDWGNSNQWLEDHDYKQYDAFLFTHDDNYLVGKELFFVLESMNDWDVLANSSGMPPGSIRGSFEFFTKKTLEKMGGKFNLDGVKLSKEGQTTASEDVNELYDWNCMAYDFTDFAIKNKLRVACLSPHYRVSMFCIEGERGYISNSHGSNTVVEDEALRHLKNMKLI